MPMVDSKWAFYIMDFESTELFGTNDAQQAGVYALNVNYCVINVEGGKVLQNNGNQDDIPEAPHVEWDPEG